MIFSGTFPDPEIGPGGSRKPPEAPGSSRQPLAAPGGSPEPPKGSWRDFEKIRILGPGSHFRAWGPGPNIGVSSGALGALEAEGRLLAPHGPMGPQGPHAPRGLFWVLWGPKGPTRGTGGLRGSPRSPPEAPGAFLEKPGFWPPGGRPGSGPSDWPRTPQDWPQTPQDWPQTPQDVDVQSMWMSNPR